MYCTHCGAETHVTHKFCAGCGKRLGSGAPVVLPAESRLQQHLPLLAVLWIVYSGLKLLAALAVLLAGRFIFMNLDLPFEAQFVPALISLVGWGLFILAAAGIAAGWGLLQKLSWARLLALALAFFALLNIPFGTALGAYTLWTLLPEESARQYDLAARSA